MPVPVSQCPLPATIIATTFNGSTSEQQEQRQIRAYLLKTAASAGKKRHPSGSAFSGNGRHR
jgi:hypothetical protein